MPLTPYQRLGRAFTRKVDRRFFQEAIERLSYPPHIYKFRRSFGSIVERRQHQDPIFRRELTRIKQTPDLTVQEMNELCCRALDESLKRARSKEKAN